MKSHILLVFLLCVCCGPSPKVQQPGREGSMGVEKPAPTPPKHNSTLLSLEQCETLFDHVFEIAFQASQDKLDDKAKLPVEEFQNIKIKLHKELITKCEGAGREEFHYSCTMAAQSTVEIEDCMGQEGSNKTTTRGVTSHGATTTH